MKVAALGNLAKDTSLPLYQQIKQEIRKRIKHRQWQTGVRLPSENELVETLGVSRMTVHRALRELTQEGLLQRVHGLGTFVAEPPRHASLITLQDIAREVQEAGYMHSCEVLVKRRITASARSARRMEVATGTPLYHLRAVHFQDRDPIQLEDRLVSPELAPEFLQQDFSTSTATQYLVDRIKPDEMEHVVSAVLPDRHTARALRIAASSPCLQLRRRTWNGRRVVTSVCLTYPGDRYDLGARYHTDQFTIHQP
jgi:GntR family histidine utilization transcriptional repressor